MYALGLRVSMLLLGEEEVEDGWQVTWSSVGRPVLLSLTTLSSSSVQLAYFRPTGCRGVNRLYPWGQSWKGLGDWGTVHQDISLYNAPLWSLISQCRGFSWRVWSVSLKMGHSCCLGLLLRDPVLQCGVRCMCGSCVCPPKTNQPHSKGNLWWRL